MSLKHPDDLQDRDILRNLDAYLGAGFQQDGFVVKRRSGETPLAFIGRVKGEYRAWYDSQTAQEARKARAAQVVDRAPGQGAPIVVTAASGAVQGPEISLADAIEAQVARLREKLALSEKAYAEANQAATVEWHRSKLLKLELSQAEKFLKEIQEGVSTPKDASEMGRDLHPKVGQRKPRRSRRVGSEDSPAGGESGSEGRDAEDPVKRRLAIGDPPA